MCDAPNRGPRFGQTLARWHHLIDRRVAQSRAQLADARRLLPAIDVLWANTGLLNAALARQGRDPMAAVLPLAITS